MVAWNGNNKDEILFFTSACQCYKARLHDFDDTKASALGDFVPSKLGFDEGETIVFACSPGEYSDHILFLFESGKLARVELSAYATVTNRRKLSKAFSDKSPLAGAMLLTGDCEMAVMSGDMRCVVFHTASIAPKSTRNTQGVGVLTPKKNQRAVKFLPAALCGLDNLPRYRVRTLPAAGAIIRPQDKGEQQLTMDNRT